jgi:penicillin V acylase-like amidase (Ntn superfamily)
MVTVASPTGEPGTVHLSISDASGDSAIFEYLDGKLVIHHGREDQIMTNSPTYDQQLALAACWKNIGGSVMLPGTNRAANRFARTTTSTRRRRPPTRAARWRPCSASCATSACRSGSRFRDSPTSRTRCG